MFERYGFYVIILGAVLMAVAAVWLVPDRRIERILPGSGHPGP